MHFCSVAFAFATEKCGESAFIKVLIYTKDLKTINAKIQ